MKRLGIDDVVPPLRNNLVVRAPPTGNGAEVIDVGPAGPGAALQLHGFEFSMARMLDGKRTAQEVMRNCAQLGIPVSLRSLEGFLRELELHGLLARAGQPASRWAAAEVRGRSPWNAEVRDGYRAALRSAREGKLEQARTQLEDLLAQEPGNLEATQVLEWVRRQQAPATAQAEQADFMRLYRKVESRWRANLPRAPGPRPHDRPQLDPAAAPNLRRWLYVAAGTALALVTLFVPLPRLISATARLAPGSEVSVAADRDGRIGTVSARDGTRVVAGAALFTWDVSTEQAQLAELEIMLAEAQAREPKAPGAEPPAASDVAFLEDRIAQLKREIAARQVVAPRAGLVRGVRVSPGAELERGQPLYTLADLAQVKLVALVTPRQARLVKVGEPVTVRLGDRQFPTRVEGVTTSEITATLQTPGADLQPGTELVDLELTPASLWQRVW